MTKAAMLNPETFVEGGGLIDDIDVVLKKNEFVLYDYNGTVTPATPALRILMTDDSGTEYEQMYSIGKAEDWLPSEDGKQLLAVGKAEFIRASANGGILLKSLVDAGFPAEKLGDDISVLDGTVAHVMRVPAPVSGNKKQTPKQKEREEKYGPPTILVISEIKSFPWDVKKPAGAPTAAGKPAAAKAKATPAAAKTKATPAAAKAQTATETTTPDGGAGGGDLATKAMGVVMETLTELGQVTKKDLPMKLFTKLGADPDKAAIIRMVFDDTFLSAGPWSYENETLSMGQ